MWLRCLGRIEVVVVPTLIPGGDPLAQPIASNTAVSGRPIARLDVSASVPGACRSRPRAGRAAPTRPKKRHASIKPQPEPAQGRSSKAARPRRASDQQCRERECRQYPGLKRTRASANTSGPDSTVARRPLVKLRSPLRRTAPNEENSFLLPDRQENDPTVDLMSRRHPLSSIRTSRRR